MLKTQVTAACASNVGRVRKNNEDNFYFNGCFYTEITREQPYFSEYTSCGYPQFFAIFDGMGGEDRGEDASFTAASTFAQSVEEAALKHDKLANHVRKYIHTANDAICKRITQNGGRRMGTTLAMLCINGRNAHIYNIGDSRAYILHKGKLRQLSMDHTEVQMLLEKNLITPEQAKTHPKRNRLTQHLGIFNNELEVKPHFSNISVESGDKFLLCSDGLTDMVGEERIREILIEDSPMGDIVNELVDEALLNGGRDNISVITVTVQYEKLQKFNVISGLLKRQRLNKDTSCSDNILNL